MGSEYEDLEIQNSGNGGKGDVDAASNVRDTASDAPAKAYGRGANGGSGGDGGNGGDVKFEVPQGRHQENEAVAAAIPVLANIFIALGVEAGDGGNGGAGGYGGSITAEAEADADIDADADSKSSATTGAGGASSVEVED